MQAVCCGTSKTRNDACFQRKMPSDPTNVILSLCQLLDHWNVLQKGQVRGALHRVKDRLRKVVKDVFGCWHGDEKDM